MEAVKPIMKIKLKYRVFHVKMDKMQGGSYQNGQNKLLVLRGGGFRSFIGILVYWKIGFDKKPFFNFSCMFLNPNIFFQLEF